MRTRLFMLLSSCAAFAVAPSCASPPGSTESAAKAPITATTTALTPGQDFVARNTAADAKLHVLARKFFNNQTEVLSLYEPTPGQILAVGAGRPNGASQLPRSTDIASMWGNDGMPQPLLDAIARQQAGVGIESFQSHEADAPEALASLDAETTTAAATPTVTNQAGTQSQNGLQKTQSAVIGTGYCDAQWPNDFPTNMTGAKTENCTVANPVHFIAANFAAEFGSTVAPYNKAAGCTCSCRTVQGLQHFHSANSDGSHATNQWENFASICPVRRAATVTVSASNWNQTFNVAEDNFLWLEDTGTVTCFATTCSRTNDIGTFNVSVTSQTSLGDGLINYIAEAYGP